MDEDKVVSDVSDKRRIEDDNLGPKPNTKRIKLVRPVFSPVVKPLISSTFEVNKSDVQPIEISKSSISSDKILNVVDISQTSNQSIDQLEIIKTYTDKLETVTKPITAPVVPEEEVISSSDDLQNLFSEETKKELEHLKKNIFKIDDDGSSSENDSQPKRPRLKRPTFVTSAIENKSESNDTTTLEKINDTSKLDFIKSVCEENKEESNNMTILDKINETSKLDLTKSVCEENKEESNNMTILDKINETSKLDFTNSKCEDNLNKIAENIIETTQSVEKVNTKSVEKVNTKSVDIIMEENPIVFENINKEIENKSIVSHNVDEFVEKSIKSVNKITEEFSILTENIKEIEKIEHTTSEKIIKDEIKNFGKVIEEKYTKEDNSYEIGNETNVIKLDDNKMKPNIKNDLPEENVEKIITDILSEKELINNGRINQAVEEKEKTKKDMNKQIVILEENINKTTTGKIVLKEAIKDNIRIVLERLDKKLIDKVQVEKSNLNIKLNNESKDNVDTNVKSDILINETIKIKDDEITSLRNEKQTSQKTDLIDNEKCSTDLLSKQNCEENESQIFKSDILKAALMSKKSPEMILSSLETQDQLDSNIHSTSFEIETKMTEVLPKIGEEAIVNKIEAEIKLANNDHLSNNTNSQNKIHSNVSEVLEINTSKSISSSISYSDNITVDNHNELPKWGSAKMNEVEKFLNDSNVTITPINKSQESPKLGKITLKLTKVGIPEIKSENIVRSNVKSELIKKITNKQIAMGDSPLKNALSHPNKSFGDFATIRPAPKASAEQIALLEQQILNTPKKRGRPSKVLTQQKQLLLQYQQQQQQKLNEGNPGDEIVFHVPLFDMEDMSGGAGMFESFNASTPKKEKSIRGKGSRGRRGRGGGRIRGHDGSDSDTANSRRRDDIGEIFHEEINQEEETRQVAMIEAERLRKEEEREKKLEARKKKLKERNDAIKEKKMKKKQKAEERRLQWHEKKRLMQEEKLRAAEMKKSLPPPQNFDDETRMSADCNNSRSQTPARNFMIGEDDLSISGTTNDSLRLKKGRMEVIDLESNKTLTVDQIAEYQWPLEGGELYMIQEQISNFLGVKSFKRKYPGLKRRNVEAEERTFLCDSGLVAESLCDLGLTVLYSSEVLDIMYTDFPEKYEELREFMRLKHAKELTNRQRALMTISSNADGSKLDLRDRAMESVANWNASLNKSRFESRKCSMDMQTFIVHYPKNKCKKMTIPKPKIGSYPLALLPGQFCDYYATYSSEDLRYLPMNTVMYGPMKSVDKDFPVSLSSQSESEDSSSEDSSDSDDSIDIDNKSGKNNLEYGPSDKKGAECKHCLGTADKNKKGTIEPLIHCSKCLTIYHPTCLDMTLEMVPYIKRYNWQCNECKFCAQCKEVADEDKMLFCDLCDRGYHIYCVGLRRVPEGRWHCQECAMCSSCGVSDPGPGDSKWFYEFKKIEKTGSKVYCRTLCAPCSRLWKKGHYCPNCMRCYPIKNVERMTQCNSCDRYLHPECINENTSNSQVVACTMCEEKAVSRLLTTVPRSLIKV